MWQRAAYNALQWLSLPFQALLLNHRVRPHMKIGEYFFSRWRGPIDRSSYLTLTTTWVHAVSVGEVLTVSPLLDLMASHETAERLLVTTITATGWKTACTELSCQTGLAPFDFYPLPLKFVRKFGVRRYIGVETEIWPETFWSLSQSRIPIWIANGRISTRAFKRYMSVRSLIRPVFGLIHGVAARTDLDAHRFMVLGVPEERITVVGNLKYDSTVHRLSKRTEPAWLAAWVQDCPLVIFGSWVEKEFPILFETLKHLHICWPEIKVLIAPRQPRDAHVLLSVLRCIEPLTGLRSQESQICRQRWLVLDTIGELALCYRRATLAIIGGSFHPALEGHNPIEPAWFGVPIIMGPAYESFQDIVEEFRSQDAMVIVPLDKELAEVVDDFLSHPHNCELFGVRARAIVEQNIGVARKVFDFITNN